MDIEKSDSSQSVDRVEEFVEKTVVEYHRHKIKNTTANEPIEEDAKTETNIDTKVNNKVECNSCSCCK